MRTMGVLCVLLMLAVPGLAQTPIPVRRSAPRHKTASPSEVIKLGESVLGLTGPWRFHPGDSPEAPDGSGPVWAQPGFDDNGWVELTLKGREGATDPLSGVREYVPGWTAKGFRTLSGYAWYRLQVKLLDAGPPVWLKMPSDVDDAYQVFGNGKYLGQFGEFERRGVVVHSARAVSFPLPPPDENGKLVLAIRFYMQSDTPFYTPAAGGMHQAPAIGLAPTIALMQASDDDANIHGYIVAGLLQALVLGAAGFAALWAWVLSRTERAYLWLMLASWLTAGWALVVFLGGATYVVSDVYAFLLSDVIFSPLVPPCWVMFWWYWFGLARRWRLLEISWAATAVRMLALACLRRPLHSIGPVLRHATFFRDVEIASEVVLGGVLVAVVILGIRKNRTEGLLAVIPLLLLAIALFGTDLLVAFGARTVVFPFGMRISLLTMANVLLYAAVSVLVVRRLLLMRAQQQAVALELQQASELQNRVLRQESIPLTSRFKVEVEYIPSQVVGGDFFQILPQRDGSVLVVAGDVSGKGITAAMLVAVLVGAIRVEAEHTCEPDRILHMLNERLHGRMDGGFATCMAAHFEEDGTVHIASAGHLPPYLNGTPLAIEGELPLGIVTRVEYPVHSFRIEAGDRLTFISDGVLEATNENGELYGFDRAQQVSTLPAAAIAEEARVFGQCDDITVLTVAFAGQPAAVAVGA